jgi:hypothetical protein
VSETFEINTSTNSIEAINKKLKSASNDGKISFDRACVILFNFKEQFRSEYEFKVLQNCMNPCKM